MSALLAQIPVSIPGTRRPATEPVRRVEVVPSRAQRKARPRVLYAVITVSSLFVLFMAQLLLSIAVSDGAYQISSLQVQKVELARQEAALAEQVDIASSTQNLALQAESLGMVLSGTSPAFLNLSTGKVTGRAQTTVPSADGVLQRSGSLVENSLLEGAPLVAPAEQAADAAATDAAAAEQAAASPVPAAVPVIGDGTAPDATTTSVTGGAPATTGGTTPLPSGGLPSPVTH
jgi:hypothetical protein